jgi:hypothetical protein
MIAYKKFFDLHPEIERIGLNYIGGISFGNFLKFQKIVNELNEIVP